MKKAIITISGPQGCGKSTLIELLRVLSPSVVEVVNPEKHTIAFNRDSAQALIAKHRTRER